MAFARCPKCGHHVETPNRVSLLAWRLLTCPGCKTGLALVEHAPKMVLPVIVVFFLLYAWVRLVRPTAFLEGMVLGGYAVALFSSLVFWLWEISHPELKVRRRPRPEITLNI